MTNKIGITVVTLLVATLGQNIAYAGTPHVNQRQDNQAERIAQGVRNGELTVKETHRLIRGQAELQQLEDRVKRDGVVTSSERARLHHKANIEANKIRREKNDGNQRRTTRR